MRVPIVFQRIWRSRERAGVNSGLTQPEPSVEGVQRVASPTIVRMACWSVARSGPSPVVVSGSGPLFLSLQHVSKEPGLEYSGLTQHKPAGV